MIITCLACQKKYFIENDAVPEKGRQVRCGECGNTWWQEASEMLVLDPRRDGIIEKDRIPPNLNPGLSKFENTLENEDKPRGLRAFIHNYYLDWLVIVLALFIVLFVTFRERGTLFDQVPTFKRAINPHIGSSPSAPGSGLIVQGINYDTTHHNNMPHIIITGELVNASAGAIPVPPLTITVSGKHNEQVMQPKSHTWQHANKDEQLLPGARLPFQSITTHPGWSTIDKIDVSY